jgi:hypothetical protein
MFGFWEKDQNFVSQEKYIQWFRIVLVTQTVLNALTLVWVIVPAIQFVVFTLKKKINVARLTANHMPLLQMIIFVLQIRLFLMWKIGEIHGRGRVSLMMEF